jgi:hypothetical protein
VTELAFVCCVEAGPLEAQMVLLARSIRRWAGPLAGCPIHAYRPREGEALAPATVQALGELEVALHEELLNVEHAGYPMANKLHVCAAAEHALREDMLVWTDTDTVFTNPPSELVLPEGADVAVRPVGDVGWGSSGPGDENEPYWERLYDLAGAADPPWTVSARTGLRIRGYWSAGLVAGRRTAGVFAGWLEVFRRLLAERHVPGPGLVNNLDQLALAGALGRRPEAIVELDDRYNYVIGRRGVCEGRLATIDLDELVHVHYTRWFNRVGFLELLDPPLRRDTPQYRWLQSFLPLDPVMEEPLHGQEPEGFTGKRGRRKLRRLHGTRRTRYTLEDLGA